MKRTHRSNFSMLAALATEQPNPRSANLDTKSALEIAHLINSEDARVAAVVKRALPKIARAIDVIAGALSSGGRLIYVGAGTSGRLAALDAAECPPTFNTDPTMVQAVIAGGSGALGRALEANEDSSSLGRREMRKRRVGPKDVVVGIAASGRTPFTIAALSAARSGGAKTIAITSNPRSPLESAADFAIVVETGPEVVTGSTRMKAGTAQKMVLNMLTTGAMVRLGYVYGNLMVNMHRSNSKLADRATRMLQSALSISKKEARLLLRKANGNMPVAIVMTKASSTRSESLDALKKSKGNVRAAISLLARNTR